jgi:hypothetical protein
MKSKFTFTTAIAIATLSMAFSTPKASAQDASGALITAATGAIGYAIGNQFEDSWGGAPYAGAGIGAALGNWGYNSFRKKSDAEKMKYYISGANYQRWIMSQEIWYQSTLNPHTGRPQAFSGLNAMDDGMPQNHGQPQPKQDISHVYTVPVKLPAGTYQGVPHTERIGQFPKLP